MDSGEGSLRRLIDKWVGQAPWTDGRIFRISHTDACKARCICVEIPRASGLLSLMFFQHDDGSWWVFPPAAHRPSLRSG